MACTLSAQLLLPHDESRQSRRGKEKKENEKLTEILRLGFIYLKNHVYNRQTWKHGVNDWTRRKPGEL